MAHWPQADHCRHRYIRRNPLRGRGGSPSRRLSQDRPMGELLGSLAALGFTRASPAARKQAVVKTSRPDLTVETETGRSGPDLEADESVSQKKRRRAGRSTCFIVFVLAVAGALAGWLGNLWIAFDVFSQFSL